MSGSNFDPPDRPIPTVRIVVDRYAHTTRVYAEDGTRLDHIERIEIMPIDVDHSVVRALVTISRAKADVVAEALCGGCRQPLPLPVVESNPPQRPSIRACPYCESEEFVFDLGPGLRSGCRSCRITTTSEAWRKVRRAAHRGWGAL